MLSVCGIESLSDLSVFAQELFSHPLFTAEEVAGERILLTKLPLPLFAFNYLKNGLFLVYCFVVGLENDVLFSSNSELKSSISVSANVCGSDVSMLWTSWLLAWTALRSDAGSGGLQAVMTALRDFGLLHRPRLLAVTVPASAWAGQVEGILMEVFIASNMCLSANYSSSGCNRCSSLGDN